MDNPILLANGTLDTNGAATGSISPTANRPVYVCLGVAASSSITPGSSFALSGCNLTWTLVAGTDGVFGVRRYHAIWKGVGTSPSDGGVTITFTPDGGAIFQSVMYAIFDAPPTIDTTTPNTNGVTNSGDSGTASTSGVGTPDAGDGVLSMFLHTTAENAMAGGAEAGSELVDFADTAGSPNVRRMAVYFNASPDSSPEPSATFTTDTWGATSIILNVGGAQELAGTAAGEATATAAATVEKPLAGGGAGQATATGAAAVEKPLAGAASGQAAATGELLSGTITSAPIKNNTGTLLANQSGATVFVYATTGPHVATLTGQATNASAVMTITDPAIVAGTEYHLIGKLASGALFLGKAVAT